MAKKTRLVAILRPAVVEASSTLSELDVLLV